MDYDKLLDKIEEIQDCAYATNIGSNEEQLEVRTEVIKHLQELDKNNEVLDLVSESLIDLKQLVADKTLELLDLTANNQYTHDLKKQIEFAINSINAIK